MIENGADINAVTEEGDTPIMIAIRSFNYELIELLLEQENLDLSVITKKDQNAFHHLTNLLKSIYYCKGRKLLI